MTIKKTPAASLTFNPRWSKKQMCKQHNATKQIFFFEKTKTVGEKTAVIVSWQFVDSIANLNPEWRRLQINPEFDMTKMVSSELMEAQSDGELEIYINKMFWGIVLHIFTLTFRSD